MFSIFNVFAEKHVVRLPKINPVRDCTVTATATSSAEVDCPGGSTITIGASSSYTATAENCDDAAAVAQITANAKASATVQRILTTKDYICD